MFVNGVEKVYIIKHTGDTLDLFVPIQNDLSSPILLLAGCDKSLDTCLNKFDNISRYGGFPYIPEINPVTGEF